MHLRTCACNETMMMKTSRGKMEKCRCDEGEEGMRCRERICMVSYEAKACIVGECFPSYPLSAAVFLPRRASPYEVAGS